MLHDTSPPEQINRYRVDLIIASGYGKQIFIEVKPSQDSLIYQVHNFKVTPNAVKKFEFFDDAWKFFLEI